MDTTTKIIVWYYMKKDNCSVEMILPLDIDTVVAQYLVSGEEGVERSYAYGVIRTIVENVAYLQNYNFERLGLIELKEEC